MTKLTDDELAEKTPEDRVREYYEKLQGFKAHWESEGFDELAITKEKELKSVRHTLNLLDIQIPGVNCEEDHE